MNPCEVETRPVFEQLLFQIHAESCAIQDIREQPGGAQGASGSQVRYFDVTSSSPRGAVHQDVLVTKSASLRERQVLQLLSSQGCAVPPLIISDVTTADRRPVVMPFLEARPPLDLGHPSSPLTYSIADGLAGIHAANMNRPPAWMPRTGDDFLGRLWLKAWREQWEANLRQPEFAAEFGGYTARLEAAMQ